MFTAANHFDLFTSQFWPQFVLIHQIKSTQMSKCENDFCKAATRVPALTTNVGFIFLILIFNQWASPLTSELRLTLCDSESQQLDARPLLWRWMTMTSPTIQVKGVSERKPLLLLMMMMKKWPEMVPGWFTEWTIVAVKDHLKFSSYYFSLPVQLSVKPTRCASTSARTHLTNYTAPGFPSFFQRPLRREQSVWFVMVLHSFCGEWKTMCGTPGLDNKLKQERWRKWDLLASCKSDNRDAFWKM